MEKSIARRMMLFDDLPNWLSFDEKRQHIIERPSNAVSLWVGSHGSPPNVVRGPETSMAISPFELYGNRGYDEVDEDGVIGRIMRAEDVDLVRLLRACRFVPHDGRMSNQHVLHAAAEIGDEGVLTIIGSGTALSGMDERVISEVHDLRSFECPLMFDDEMYVAVGEGWGVLVEWVPLMETVRGRFAGVFVEWIGMCIPDSSLIRGIRPRGSDRSVRGG